MLTFVFFDFLELKTFRLKPMPMQMQASTNMSKTKVSFNSEGIKVMMTKLIYLGHLPRRLRRLGIWRTS